MNVPSPGEQDKNLLNCTALISMAGRKQTTMGYWLSMIKAKLMNQKY
jgi:hypothetical protein